jgi:hypothetical protein
LDLSRTRLTFIAPGAFQGKKIIFRTILYNWMPGLESSILNSERFHFVIFINWTGNAVGNGTRIFLNNNPLQRFHYAVFQPVLEKLATNGGYPNAYVYIEGSMW